MSFIDLNSGVGESSGNWTMDDDAAVFRHVTSANVACDFHAGDISMIARTCRDAVAAGVTIGVHVGYRDLAGFGRRFLDFSATELADDVLYQLGAVQALARRAGAVRSICRPRLQPGRNVGFPPRGGSRAARHKAITENMVRLATEGKIIARDGSVVNVRPDITCVHGDTPGAAAMASAVRPGLEDARVTVRSFA